MAYQKSGYMGNPNLKPEGETVQFTKEQVEEYIKCSKDPNYFIEKYIKVVSLDKGLVPFHLYDYQAEMLQTIHNNRFIIAKLPRQSGKTTTVTSYLLHYILFNQSVSVAVLANKQSTAKDILSRLKLSYEYLPKWLQQGVKEWNKYSIVLENGSKVLASATSSSAIRGGSYNCISGNSIITVKDLVTNQIFNISIAEFYANSSRNMNNYKYSYEHNRQQIQELVFFTDEESTIKNIKRKFSNRKSSYYSEVYGWDERKIEYSFIDHPGTYTRTSITSEIFNRKRKSENVSCVFSDGSWKTGTNDHIDTNRTCENDERIFGGEKNYEIRNKTFRGNEKKNFKIKYRKSTVNGSKTKTINSNDRKIFGIEIVAGPMFKNINWVEGEKENKRTLRQNKQKSRENSKDCRKTPWNEEITGIKKSNENIGTKEISTSGSCLEQRNEIYKWEVLTRNGFEKFHGISKTNNQITLNINTESSNIVCTPDHKISTIDGFIEAKNISIGTKIYCSNGKYSDVIGIDKHRSCDVYDLLHVENTHSFYANGLEVHNCIVLDEYAHVPTNVAEEFFSSVYPTITSGQSTRVIMISTPKGLNMFYHFWKGAQSKQNEYVPIEVTWDQVPKYPGGPRRDEEWKRETIRNSSERQFAEEFQCEFVGSSNTLLSSAKLNTLTWRKPLSKTNDGLTIYEEPIKGGYNNAKTDHTYFMVVDVAKGQGKDHSAFTVIDITQMPYNIVAKFRNNIVSPLLFPSIIRSIGKKYNSAYCMVELNDIGSQVADILHTDLEYENLIKTNMRGRKGQIITEGFGGGKTQQLGVRTSNVVKKLGCAVLKNLIENDKLIVEDAETIEELTTFIATTTSFKADDGYTDDLVMTLVLFAWATRQDFFKNLTDNDVRLAMYSEDIQKIEDELLPFGFSNGIEDIIPTSDEKEWSDNDKWLIIDTKTKNWEDLYKQYGFF